jgi:magnesium-protoporphyrin IX monomethyl ester (oxidative) cyclase
VIALDEVASTVYLGLFRGAGREGIRRRLSEAGLAVTDDGLEQLLSWMVQRGLVYEDEERYVALALGLDPFRKRLVDGREEVGAR